MLFQANHDNVIARERRYIDQNKSAVYYYLNPASGDANDY